MAVIQRLSINTPQTSRNKIVVRDDTGPYTKTNINGYGGYNGIPISLIWKYIFLVTDKISGHVTKRVFGPEEGEETNPPVERIAYREDVDLIPFSGKFPDSIYTVTMVTVMKDEYDGTGFKDQNFIINAPGVSAIQEFDAIVDPLGNTYKITGIEDGIILLDRDIVEDFEYFNVALYTVNDTPIVIYQSLEDCVTSKILQFIDSEECSTRTTNSINELRMLYWGLKFSIDRNDYNQSLQYMHKVQNICGFLNCGCNG